MHFLFSHKRRLQQPHWNCTEGRNLLDVRIAPPSQGVLVLLFKQSSVISSKDTYLKPQLNRFCKAWSSILSLWQTFRKRTNWQLGLEEIAKNLPYAILVLLSHFHQLFEKLWRLRLIEYIPSGYRLLQFNLVSVFTFLSFKLFNCYDSVRVYDTKTFV